MSSPPSSVIFGLVDVLHHAPRDGRHQSSLGQTQARVLTPYITGQVSPNNRAAILVASPGPLLKALPFLGRNNFLVWPDIQEPMWQAGQEPQAISSLRSSGEWGEAALRQLPGQRSAGFWVFDCCF